MKLRLYGYGSRAPKTRSNLVMSSILATNQTAKGLKTRLVSAAAGQCAQSRTPVWMLELPLLGSEMIYLEDGVINQKSRVTEEPAQYAYWGMGHVSGQLCHPAGFGASSDGTDSLETMRGRVLDRQSRDDAPRLGGCYCSLDAYGN